MPHSTPIFKQETIAFIKSSFTSDVSILDIGAGAGTYSTLLKSSFPNMDCVEVFEPYIEMFDLKSKYNNVYNENILNFDFKYYDLILLGDILEHISKSDAIYLIEKLYNKCKELIIAVPFHSEQGVHYDNEHEIHLQSDLSHDVFMQRFPNMRPLGLRYDYGVYIKSTNANTDLPIVIEKNTIDTFFPDHSKSFIDGIKQQFPGSKIFQYEDIKESEFVSELTRVIGNSDTQNNNLINNNIKSLPLTIVSGLWDINRAGRDWSRYEEHFDKFLKIPCNMILWIPKSLESFVWERRDKNNTHVIIYELEDIRDGIFSPFWSKWQSIRTKQDWQNQAGWLPNSPQCKNEYYNPIVMSKMFFLHDSKVRNPFNTDYFIWLDAGISQTCYENYFYDKNILERLIKCLDPFLFLSYPYEASNEIHGFEFNAINRYAREKVDYVCRGGLFGGHKDILSEVNNEYYHMLDNTLSQGYAGTEESVFSILAKLSPEKYRRYPLDENGLVVKFLQALNDDNVELEEIKGKRPVRKTVVNDISNVKTNLYFLTFNYPEQLEYTIKSLQSHNQFLNHPTEKVVIDNSTNDDARKGNAEICNKYGFKHIIRNENTGINGGRQFAAEHFHDSGSDYYLFFEDDMTLANSEQKGSYCRNGLRQYIPDLYKKLHQIMIKEEFDFLKLSFTEVYMDNNIQTSWYNVPQNIRDRDWPEYNLLPQTGLDPHSPRTLFKHIERLENGLAYITGDIYYANWPMIVSREGNKKMFIDTTWAFPYEQTWMSHMYQLTKENKLKPACLLASPVIHDRFKHYTAAERREC
jgi:hypothetical protein